MSIDAFDCEELLWHILDVDLNSDDYESLLEETLHSQYGMNTEEFAKLMDRLLPLIGMGTWMGDTMYKGFSIPVEWAAPGTRLFLLKTKA